MNLYLVKRRDQPGYDEYGDMIVRAESEGDAAALAALQGMSGDFYPHPSELLVELIPLIGEPDVILAEFHAG